MDALTSFIIVIIAITVQFSLYAIKRLQEPLEPSYLIDKNSKEIRNNSKQIDNFRYFSIVNEFRVSGGFLQHMPKQ